MRTEIVPELEDLLDDSAAEIYPYGKSFEDAQMDPCLVLHTTGSTGLPKPIIWKVGILSTYEAWRTIPTVNGYVPTTELYQQSRRAYTSMPLYHTSGINAGITWALLLGVTLVYGAPHVVPNALYADEMHKFAGVDASMGAPSIYEELSRDNASLQRINKLYYVVASGAPLSYSAGMAISKHTRVICNLGATETACLQRLAPAIDDWAYFYWHPTYSGIQMRKAMDGLYELFIVKDPSRKLYQGIFNTFPDIQEWSMKDLYSRHPDPAKNFLYRYQGRKDDIIVLSNGEKIAPALMEATLMSHPLVKGAMIVGQGKFQPAVIIDLAEEPPKDTAQRHRMIERLLPVISEANVHAPAHGKIDQYHILFADPQRPITYLGQGKIQRKQTYRVYKTVIEELYKAADDASEHFGPSKLSTIDFCNEESVIQGLRQLIADIAGVSKLDTNEDLFTAGVDSLQVIRIARELRIEARKANLENNSVDKFQPSAIYKHPSLNLLKSFVLAQRNVAFLIDGVSSVRTGNQNRVLEERNKCHSGSRFTSEHMHETLQRYGGSLPHTSKSSPSPLAERMIVVLTGSTGSLGSYLLDALYHNERVSRIICLNRSSKAAERHKQMSVERGLSSLDSNRVEFLKADLSKPQLGLSAASYEYLRSLVTHVILKKAKIDHVLDNQWPVNFNWVLSSFEPHILGVRNLIDFSLASKHKSFILFISSVSAVGSWKGPNPIPEEPIHNLSAASKMGYGQSKLISECLLDEAGKNSGVRSTCCRIFISSAFLGVFPSTFPSRNRIDWLPVDKLSTALIEILIISSSPSFSSAAAPRRLSPHWEQTQNNGTQDFYEDEGGTQVFHLVNPKTTTWSSQASKFLALYSPALGMRAVPFHRWIEVLSQSQSKAQENDELDGSDPERNPAVKLVDFYHHIAKTEEDAEMKILASGKAERASFTLRSLEAMNERYVRRWMKQWKLMGEDK
ncbi:MAG: hypothetical protein Q9167_003526 [Letrouitia subvulpina]